MHAQRISVLRLLIIVVFVLQSVCSQNGNKFSDSVGYQSFGGQSQPRPVQQECCHGPLEVQQRSRVDHQRTPKSIPLDLARKLNSIENMDQFFVEFVDVDGHSYSEGNLLSKRPYSGHSSRGVRLSDRQLNGARDIEPQISVAQIPQLQSSRSSQRQVTIRSVINGSTHDSQPEKRSSAQIPKFAGCTPEQRTVNLRDTDDPTMFYYPSCTRVDRCGGCCSHELLTCQPKTKQYINYTVHVSKYIGKSKLEYRGTKVVTVEKHTKCNCECKVKPTDCTSQQKYEENDCRCICTNKEEEERCSQEEKTKLWNPSTCQCQCREIHECSSGFFFDESRCMCSKSQKTPPPPEFPFDSRYQIGGYGP